MNEIILLIDLMWIMRAEYRWSWLTILAVLMMYGYTELQIKIAMELY